MTAHRELFDPAPDTVGETPLVKVHASPDEVSVHAKLRLFNPGASIKDRIGKYMLERILESGKLPEGGTIAELTADNTGIGFTVTVGQLGTRTVFVIPRRFNVEKQTFMCTFGADAVNTSTKDGMGSAIDRAHKLADEFDDATVPQQFSSLLNPEAHYETIAPEVYDALDGEAGALVASCDTMGTLMGMARHGHGRNEDTFVTAAEPERLFYARLRGHDVVETSYRTEGIGTRDPATNELFGPELVDELVQITNRDTHGEMQRLVAEGDHLVASSVTVSSLAAIDVAERAAVGDFDLLHDAVVTVFSDSSKRCLLKSAYGDFKSWEG